MKIPFLEQNTIILKQKVSRPIFLIGLSKNCEHERGKVSNILGRGVYF